LPRFEQNPRRKRRSNGFGKKSAWKKSLGELANEGFQKSANEVRNCAEWQKSAWRKSKSQKQKGKITTEKA